MELCQVELAPVLSIRQVPTRDQSMSNYTQYLLTRLASAHSDLTHSDQRLPEP